MCNFVEREIKRKFEKEDMLDYLCIRVLERKNCKTDELEEIGVSYKFFGTVAIKYMYKKSYILVNSKQIKMINENKIQNDKIFSTEKVVKSDGNFVRFSNAYIFLDSHLEKILRTLYKECRNNVQCEFDCCSRYNECSNEKKCVNENKKISMLCSYRKKLERGIVFFGKK